MADSNDLERVRAALREALDTGNALYDIATRLGANPEIDTFEFEQALVGMPETIDGVERNMEYYIGMLRDAYIERVIIDLDHQEKEHHG
jgi:hypothetical protein